VCASQSVHNLDVFMMKLRTIVLGLSISIKYLAVFTQLQF